MKTITITVKLSDSQFEQLSKQTAREDYSPQGYLAYQAVEALNKMNVDSDELTGWFDTTAEVKEG